jgi:hypothetical protein
VPAPASAPTAASSTRRAAAADPRWKRARLGKHGATELEITAAGSVTENFNGLSGTSFTRRRASA